MTAMTSRVGSRGRRRDRATALKTRIFDERGARERARVGRELAPRRPIAGS